MFKALFRSAAKFALLQISRLLSIAPRNNYVIFIGPTLHSYKDNVRAAFELLNTDLMSRGLYPLWITDSELVYDKISKAGYSAMYRKTFKSTCIFLRAKLVFSGETAAPKLNKLFSLGAKHICVSHGFGPRSTVACDGTYFKSNKSVREALGTFDMYLFPNRYLSMQLGILQYDMDESKFLFANQPRLDPRYISNFPSALSLDKTKLNVFYCPTWRQDGTSPMDLLKRTTSLEMLLDNLEDYNAVLWISGHPLSNNENNITSDHIRYIGGACIDPSVFIRSCDIVVTDYSSLMTDAIFHNKKLFLYCPDLDFFQFSYGLNVMLKHEFDNSCFIEKISESFDGSRCPSKMSYEKYAKKFCCEESLTDFKHRMSLYLDSLCR